MGKLSGQRVASLLCLGLVFVSGAGTCRTASAAVTHIVAPAMSAASFIPEGTIWLLTLRANAALAQPNHNTFFKDAIERRPVFHRLQEQVKKVLGINISKQVKSWWLFGSTQGSKSGTLILDTTVMSRTIIDQLKRRVKTPRGFYDGITIFRVDIPAKRRAGRKAGPVFVAVVRPGMIVASLSETLLEHSLDCHLGIKKSVTPHSHLFSGLTTDEIMYFSAVHLQRAIDAAQNPLAIPPQIRSAKAIHIMVRSTRQALELHGYLRMVAAKAAARSAAQLKALKKLAYHANSGANATDRQMILAGVILRFQADVKGNRVLFHWSIPYSLLARLGPPHHRGG